MGNTVFNLKNSKQIFFLSIPSVFAFKQAKGHILLQVKPLKMFVKKIVVLILGLQSTFSEALRPRKEAT